MRFLAIMVTMFVVSNAALAQTDPATATPGDPSTTSAAAPATPDSLSDDSEAQAPTACPANWSIDECCSALGNCSTTLTNESAACTAQLNGLAQTCGYQTRDEALAADCRSRHGTLAGSECTCQTPRHWNNAEDKACCVTNPAAYERRRERCEDSDGTFHCSQRGDGGWCSCLPGMFLNEDGECEGEAVGRERIQEMRNDITSLTAERDRLQARADELARELETAESEGDQLQADLEAAKQELAAVRRYLDFLRDILAARGIEAPSEGEVAGAAVPPAAEGATGAPPGEIPGAREAVAEVAAESTRVPPGEIPQTSEPEEESWCEENPGICAVIIIGATAAAAGLGVGLYEALKPPPEVEIGFDYNR